MALSPAQIALCTALFAGPIGFTGGAIVTKSPTVKARPAVKPPAAKRYAPPLSGVTSRYAPQGATILDCPSPGLGGYVMDATDVVTLPDLQPKPGRWVAFPGDPSFPLGGGGGAPGSVVPEPQTWGMMLMGFGLTGLSLRKREKVVVS